MDESLSEHGAKREAHINEGMRGLLRTENTHSQDRRANAFCTGDFQSARDRNDNAMLIGMKKSMTRHCSCADDDGHST